MGCAQGTYALSAWCWRMSRCVPFMPSACCWPGRWRQLATPAGSNCNSIRNAHPCPSAGPTAVTPLPPPPQEVDIDNRMALYQHIVVSGGSTMYPGLPTRLEKDIRQLYNDRVLNVGAGLPDLLL